VSCVRFTLEQLHARDQYHGTVVFARFESIRLVHYVFGARLGALQATSTAFGECMRLIIALH
jgi:hypothetical protein